MVREDAPGARWQSLVEWAWPAYLAWFLREGEAARPSYLECRAALKRHMPELLDTYDRLVALLGGGDVAARLLSLYRPTPYLTGCSQAVWRDPPALVRNYDYSPHLCEGSLLRTEWHGRPVMAMSDCLWGALDGVNGDGLCVALAFGGSKAVGDGFGIPLALRYVLEFCSTTKEAVKALTRIPVHMAYNVTVVDEKGRHATIRLAPGRTPEVTDRLVATNHQGEIRWAEHAALTRTEEREAALEACLGGGVRSLAALVDAFLSPPIYSSAFRRGWGTLYTASYIPAARSATFAWPHARVVQALDHFVERDVPVVYS
ncbi:MAG: hypothetical protein IBJ10_06995 [Phycisphaerales bacterium]|nr:hypothetical protein [Phycisphaerales bacterium]